MNARLIAAGWKHTPSGRWIHPDAPPLAHGRRRVFTEAEALTLLAADSDEDTQDENVAWVSIPLGDAEGATITQEWTP